MDGRSKPEITVELYSVPLQWLPETLNADNYATVGDRLPWGDCSSTRSSLPRSVQDSNFSSV